MGIETVAKIRSVQKLLSCPRCRTKGKHKFCVEKVVKKVLEIDLPVSTLEEILKYDEFLDASTVGEVSRCHYFLVFGQMHEVLGSFEFGKLKLRDFLNFRDWCVDRFSYYTAFMKVAKVKAFYRWRNGGQLPKELESIKMHKPVSERVNEKNVLKVDEVIKLSKATSCPRDEAFIYCLWESTRRIEEFLRMKARDLKFVTTPKGEYAYYKTYVDKARGEKREAQSNFIVSYPALLTWLKEHPAIDLKLMMRNDEEAEQLKYEKSETHDPDAPVWCMYRYGKSRGERVSRDQAWFIVRRAQDRAGIRKPASPHRLRHSRITWMKLNDYTDEEVRIACGYSRLSKMPLYYTHVGQEDFMQKQLRMHGLIPESKEKEKLKIRHCNRCNAPNEPTADFCMRCGEALTDKAKGEIKQTIDKPNNLITELLKDREFKEFMVKKMAELQPQKALI